ncbi:WcbI family polysaccharide biosynthesis putative acetyltransferase [Parasphingopyxis lamellibrachiae]|uniref:FkbM family methyltransferase n=1 Tax=Parasphingopyxis lamellibrachiae TaxID=680125 RepID=A0A3D9FGE9_9SPHN|nr:WcbI family polysaccharide biosynthesis putative acetyltransferase [Parasphingopyxis lamellibrachiae]RED16171.1 FkbM family methyltransferase [Parasphingopyxis lamellibrachiae]
MKLMVYANCQAGPVSSLLGLANSDLEIIRCPAVHTLTSSDIPRIQQLVEACDVIVHQPISDNFGPLATEMLKNEYPTKTFVSFPSIYFRGLFPYLSYLRVPDAGTLTGPFSEYHDLRIVAAFLAGLSIEETTIILSQGDGDHRPFFEACLSESRSKEATTDIKVMDIVKDRLRGGDPFFTYNHPPNSVLWHVAEQVLKILELPIREQFSVPKMQYLGENRAAIPNSLLRDLNVQVRRPNYMTNGEVFEHEKLVAEYFIVYKNFEDFLAICRSNRKRFPENLNIDEMIERYRDYKTNTNPQSTKTIAVDKRKRSSNMYISSLISDIRVPCFSEILPKYRALRPDCSVLIDGGAGLGETAKKMFHRTEMGDVRVVAYEPNANNVEEFIYTHDDLTLVPSALGDSNGTASFLITDTTKKSIRTSFLKTGTSFVGKLETSNDQSAPGDRYEVPVVRMDDSLAELNINEAHFVKLDLQGGELPALKGMGDLLETVHWMWIEYGGQPGLLEFLDQRGFVLFDTEYLFVGQHNDLTLELFDVSRSGTNSIGKQIFHGHRKHIWNDYQRGFAFAQKHRRMIQTDIAAVSPRALSSFVDAAFAWSQKVEYDRFSIPRRLF